MIARESKNLLVTSNQQIINTGNFRGALFIVKDDHSGSDQDGSVMESHGEGVITIILRNYGIIEEVGKTILEKIIGHSLNQNIHRQQALRDQYYQHQR